MPKKCKAQGCDKNNFSHGYCQYHQHLRTDNKAKKQKEKQRQTFNKKQKIRQKSKKRQEQDVIYRYNKDEFIEHCQENNKYYCIFCGEGIGNYDPDIHHIKGRDDDLLLKPEFWGLAHRNCHTKYHHHPASDCDWFEDYLQRVKEIDLQVYYQDLNRFKRSSLDNKIRKE